jgi:hypothetical protein
LYPNRIFLLPDEGPGRLLFPVNERVLRATKEEKKRGEKTEFPG